MQHTLPQISCRTGVPGSTLDQWVRAGIITPSIRAGSGRGRGKDRLFSETDALAFAVAAELRRRGVGLSVIRKAVEFILATAVPGSPLVVERFLIISPGQVCLAREDATLGQQEGAASGA